MENFLLFIFDEIWPETMYYNTPKTLTSTITHSHTQLKVLTASLT